MTIVIYLPSRNGNRLDASFSQRVVEEVDQLRRDLRMDRRAVDAGGVRADFLRHFRRDGLRAGRQET
jgi:hypothetical protein